MKNEKTYIFDEYFDKVIVISLDSRSERLKSCLAQLEKYRLSKNVTVQKAIDGNVCTPPKWFLWGRGAWGCLQSHLRIIQDLMLEPGFEKKKILVLEDDVLFFKDAYTMFEKFAKKVGDRDWGQLYLGGQHTMYPEEIEPGLHSCLSVNRTHAYALHGSYANKVYMHLCSFDEYKSKDHHLDRQLEMAHRQGFWPVFAPSWWIAGQNCGVSDVNLRFNRIQWWDLHEREKVAAVPMVYIDCDESDYADYLYEEKVVIKPKGEGGKSDNINSIAAMAWVRRLMPAFRGDHETLRHVSGRVQKVVFLSDVKDKLKQLIDSRVRYE